MRYRHEDAISLTPRVRVKAQSAAGRQADASIESNVRYLGVEVDDGLRAQMKLAFGLAGQSACALPAR